MVQSSVRTKMNLSNHFARYNTFNVVYLFIFFGIKFSLAVCALTVESVCIKDHRKSVVFYIFLFSGVCVPFSTKCFYCIEFQFHIEIDWKHEICF